jgi:CDP-6-deoxy-D-xylo-4-hexulose-3-dehydrase
MKNTLTFLDRLKLAKFILSSDKFTQGPMVEKFEQEWSKWLGAKHSLFVTSGSTANFLLLAAVKEKYNLKNGDKVLVPACTWVTNINPVFQLGLEPIFCDINLKDFSFDVDNMKLLSEKHPDIKVVFTTHLLGIPAPLEEYKKHFPKAIFIDDVCESHGARTLTDKVGADSIGATFSFYFGHHMSTVEGGMISTNDSDLYDLMRMKRSHGLARTSIKFDEYAHKNPEIEKSFLFVSDGYNFRNTELGAVLGLSQLERLDSFIETRRKRYERFVDICNKSDKLYPMYAHEGNSSFCFPFIGKTAEVKSRLVELFEEHGIEYRPIVGGNLLKQPYLKTKYGAHNMPFADVLHSNGVYIGNNQFVTDKDMDIIEQIVEKL